MSYEEDWPRGTPTCADPACGVCKDASGAAVYRTARRQALGLPNLLDSVTWALLGALCVLSAVLLWAVYLPSEFTYEVPICAPHEVLELPIPLYEDVVLCFEPFGAFSIGDLPRARVTERNGVRERALRACVELGVVVLVAAVVVAQVECWDQLSRARRCTAPRT
jgi:hypothetical protein